MDSFCFKFSETIIPALSEKPVKSLGKLFNSSLKNTAAIRKTCSDLEDWLTKTDKSGLRGHVKAMLDIPTCHSAQGFVAPAAIWCPVVC